MKATEPVDYARLNLAIRRICVGNLIFSWGCCLSILMMWNPYTWFLYVIPFAAIFVSLFLSCVFAFGAIATNSISGQNRLRLNVMPVLCILFSCPCVLTILVYFFEDWL